MHPANGKVPRGALALLGLLLLPIALAPLAAALPLPIPSPIGGLPNPCQLPVPPPPPQSYTLNTGVVSAVLPPTLRPMNTPEVTWQVSGGSISVPPYPGWLSPTPPNTAWITPKYTVGVPPLTAASAPSGDYVYQFVFLHCLKNREAWTKLCVSADNEFAATLNGNPVLASSYSKSFLQQYCGGTSSGFIDGWNTLTITVHNDSLVTGLLVSGSLFA